MEQVRNLRAEQAFLGGRARRNTVRLSSTEPHPTEGWALDKWRRKREDGSTPFLAKQLAKACPWMGAWEGLVTGVCQYPEGAGIRCWGEGVKYFE